MELKVFWAVLRRRWYFVLVAIACTVGATVLVAAKVGPTYEAQGAVLVFPPVTTVQRGAESVTQGNPYLALDGVGQARDIVIRELTSKAAGDQFVQQFPGSTYEATPDVMNSAPIILITVESPSADTAVSGVASLMDRVPTTLTNLQAGLELDANSEITSKPLIADQRPESVHKDQIRAAVVAAVVTLGLSLLAIGLIDGLLTGRRGKRAAGTPQGTRGADQSDQSASPGPPGRRSAQRAVAEHATEPTKVATSTGLAASRMRPRPTPATVGTPSANGASSHKADAEGRTTKSAARRSVDAAQRG